MPEKFNRAVLEDISYGLYIVTSLSGDKSNGQIVNTLIQVTADPARVAVIINRKNLTHDYIIDSGVFGVSILDDTATLKLVGLFGFRSGRDMDKLSQVQYKLGARGCPLVTEHSLAVLEATVSNQIDVGSHTILVGEILETEVLHDGRPLTYEFYRTHLKGKTSKNAPTYNPMV